MNCVIIINRIEGYTMDDLLNYSFDLTAYYRTLLWTMVISTIIIIAFIVLRMIYKKRAKKKEKEEMDKHMEELFIKYSDVIADKVVEKLNNKTNKEDIL
jgi:F0F1-type ATP synthase membrane subunit a